MKLSRTVTAFGLALGLVVASAPVSSAAIYFPVGPFGVVNSTNKARCEAARRLYIADGYLTKPCYTANGYYYFSSTR